MSTVSTALSVRVRLRDVLMAAAVVVMAAWWWSGQSPAGADDETFTSVGPCAIFDSRVDGPNGGEPLEALQEWQVQITGAPTGQGQTDGGCDVPDTATAVEINLVAVNALLEGNLRIFEPGGAPNGGTVNYQDLEPKLNNSNAFTVPIEPCVAPLPTDEKCLVIQPNGGNVANLFNLPSVHARGIVLGFFDTGLADRVAELEALLEGLSRESVDGHDTLRLSGANFQLVDGTDDTECEGGTFTPGTFEACNGLGNLIIGYHANDSDARSGAHGLIIGDAHSYESFGHLVGGEDNTVTGRSASILGGSANFAEARGSAIAGGESNTTDADHSAISGGYFNTTTGERSTVSGGDSNTASGVGSVVSGGYLNEAAGEGAAVSGGDANTATGDWSSVSGGTGNAADGERSAVSGGDSRTAVNALDWVAGALFQDD